MVALARKPQSPRCAGCRRPGRTEPVLIRRRLRWLCPWCIARPPLPIRRALA